MSSDSSLLKTVLVALDVLEYLDAQGESCRLANISDELRLSTGRTHRLLTTLASRGYVKQDPLTREYRLGIRAWTLGRETAPYRSLVKVAKSLMDELVNQAKETVVFAILDADAVNYLYGKHGPHQVLAVIREGTRVPLHATATGKAILANSERTYVDRFMRSDLEKFTPSTIVDKQTMLHDLSATRQRGFSVTIDEWVIGLAGVAAAGIDERHMNHWAVGISWPTSRLSHDCMMQMGELARKTALRIQDSL